MLRLIISDDNNAQQNNVYTHFWVELHVFFQQALLLAQKNMKSQLALLVGFLFAIVDSLPLKKSPSIQFDIYNIKQPQLIGIIAGCCVFVITISIVVYLLYASGTLGRAFAELAADGVEIKLTVNNKVSIATSVSSAKTVYDGQPLLYDNLVEARRKKPVSPKQCFPELDGKTIRLCNFFTLNEKQITALFKAGNGTAQYHESSYDPVARLWGWMDLSLPVQDQESLPLPYNDADSLMKFIQFKVEDSSLVCLVIIDKEYDKPIGIILLADIDTPNLSLRIGIKLMLN